MARPVRHLEIKTAMPLKCFLIAAIVVVAALSTGCAKHAVTTSPTGSSTSGDQATANAFSAQQSGVQVTGAGVVTRVLPDDNEGDRHQRFILRLASGQTLLVAHNVDIAPRLPNVAPGDSVAFCGEYVWNSEGGLIHWTHHDPSGQHVAGWLKFGGMIYQ
jgi:hypothetical protein